MKKTFIYQSTAIDYQISGEGQPVVLLHGFAEAGSVWQHQIDFLKDHCQVIIPEWWQIIGANKDGGGRLRDDGSFHLDLKSNFEDNIEIPPTTIHQPPTTIDSFADFIAYFIQQISKTPVILLGHSMGGYITFAVAEKYPHLLKGFGLVHSTAFADTAEKKETRKKNIDFIRTNGGTAFLKTSVPNLFNKTYKETHPTEVKALIDAGIQFPDATLVACCAAMMYRKDKTQVLKGSRLPILFILGEEDKAAPLADVMQQVHLAETSYFHLLQKVAHMGMWEAPKETNNIILTYIQGFET